MPELPEVETIRRGLLPHILGKSISAATVFSSPSATSSSSVRNELFYFTSVLEGNHFRDIERRGKLLIFRLGRGEERLLLHLKMTGQLLYIPATTDKVTVAGGHSFTEFETALPGKHTRVQFTFEDGGHLYFNDMRRFGFLQLVSPSEFASIEARYGIEPGLPNFSLENFKKLLKSSRSVKAVLLDQTKIAGLGNIYVDEACFRAGIRPDRPVNKVVKSEVAALFLAIQSVITQAIEQRGTSFRDYRDSDGEQGSFKHFLQVYGREGQPCVQCSQSIQKSKHVGRGTHFCAHCQQ